MSVPSQFQQCRSGWCPQTESLAFPDGLCGRLKRGMGVNVWEVRTTQVPAQHEIQHEEAVFIILECITHVDDEWVIDLKNSGGGGRWEAA